MWVWVDRLALVGLGRAQSVMDAMYASDSWRVLGFTAARIAKQLKVTFELLSDIYHNI